MHLWFYFLVNVFLKKDHLIDFLYFSKKCKKSTQCLLVNQCVNLTNDKTKPNFAKEVGTTKCLPYEDISSDG